MNKKFEIIFATNFLKVKDVIKKMSLTNLFEIEYIEETKLDLGFRRKIVLYCKSNEESLRDIFLCEDKRYFKSIVEEFSLDSFTVKSDDEIFSIYVKNEKKFNSILPLGVYEPVLHGSFF